MARRCELSGKGVLTGNRVSHSNIKTRRRYLPNLNEVTLTSETLGRRFRFKVAASTLRTVDHRGGLDAYLAKAGEDQLSERALRVKREIEAKADAGKEAPVDALAETEPEAPSEAVPVVEHEG